MCLIWVHLCYKLTAKLSKWWPLLKVNVYASRKILSLSGFPHRPRSHTKQGPLGRFTDPSHIIRLAQKASSDVVCYFHTWVFWILWVQFPQCSKSTSTHRGMLHYFFWFSISPANIYRKESWRDTWMMEKKVYVSKFEVNNGARLVLLVYYVARAGKHRLFENTVFPDHSWWNTARATHDDVIKWKHFPRNWPFVREIHRTPVNFPHKGQWRGALMFSLIYAWINDWVNNREAGDSRRQHGHYDVIVMTGLILLTAIWWTMVEFREWMSNHIHTKLWAVITHQGPVSLTVFPVQFECD